jgi:hypothetical protein
MARGRAVRDREASSRSALALGAVGFVLVAARVAPACAPFSSSSDVDAAVIGDAAPSDAPVDARAACDSADVDVCFDFEGPESVGALFPELSSPGALRIELESSGSPNHVLRVDGVERYAFRGLPRGPAELRFRFRVEDAQAVYCVVGAFFHSFGGGGGAANGVALYGRGERVGPEDGTGQTLLSIAKGQWHDASVRVEGSPLRATTSVNGQAFQSTSVDTTAPEFGIRFGAFFCDKSSGGITVAFDDIVVRRL